MVRVWEWECDPWIGYGGQGIAWSVQLLYPVQLLHYLLWWCQRRAVLACDFRSVNWEGEVEGVIYEFGGML